MKFFKKEQEEQKYMMELICSHITNWCHEVCCHFAFSMLCALWQYCHNSRPQLEPFWFTVWIFKPLLIMQVFIKSLQNAFMYFSSSCIFFLTLPKRSISGSHGLPVFMVLSGPILLLLLLLLPPQLHLLSP